MPDTRLSELAIEECRHFLGAGLEHAVLEAVFRLERHAELSVDPAETDMPEFSDEQRAALIRRVWQAYVLTTTPQLGAAQDALESEGRESAIWKP